MKIEYQISIILLVLILATSLATFITVLTRGDIAPPSSEYLAQDKALEDRESTGGKYQNVDTMLSAEGPFYINDYQAKDCFGLDNGMIYRNDLFEILRNDGAKKIIPGGESLNIDLYTGDYLSKLSRDIQQMTDLENGAFRSQYICRVGNVDVVAGSHDLNESSFDDDTNDSTIYVRTADKVLSFEGIQIFNNTATGGEVSPCGAEIQTNNVVWSCFLGLSTEGDSTVSKLKDWTLPLDGSPAIEGKEYIK